ncbi:glycosyltransferase [Thalassospira lucentensis]|uniref:glycosyltransferase n=1 Tax=Thalassospira lucentensis TaxID=168935 RepID=UPI002942261F|nr:glycosyltransferase [Thalassospira lucentensis]WOI11810.1 glycosyltransferase [Thalassospira lucentensis]
MTDVPSVIMRNDKRLLTMSKENTPLTKAPTLAVFLANFNHAKYLSAALDALLSQTRQADVIYVVDDASWDNSREIIQDYADTYPHIVPVLNTQNRGYIANAQEWLYERTEDYVYFAAADDFVMPDLFERTLAKLEQHPKAGLCTSLCYMLDEGEMDPVFAPSPTPEMDHTGYVSPEAAARSLYRDDSWFWGTTTIFRRKAAVECGGYDAELYGLTDRFLSMLVSLKYGSCFIGEPLAVWRRFVSTSISAITFKDVEISNRVLGQAITRLNDLEDGVLQKGYIRRFTKRWIYSFIERQVMQPQPMDVGVVIDAVKPHLPGFVFGLDIVLRIPSATIRRALLAIILRPYDLKRAIVRRFESQLFCLL